MMKQQIATTIILLAAYTVNVLLATYFGFNILTAFVIAIIAVPIEAVITLAVIVAVSTGVMWVIAKLMDKYAKYS